MACRVPLDSMPLVCMHRMPFVTRTSYSAGGQRLIPPISPHFLQRVAVYAYHHVAMRM